MTDDWRDLLSGLQAAGARYLVVGAHALAVHGVPRGTHDLDLWIDSTRDNAERVWRALLEFGAPLPSLGITVDDLSRPDVVVQLGLPPNRVDLLTSLTGISTFDDAWADRLDVNFEGVRTGVLSRRALIQNKRATGRLKDLSDLEALGEVPPEYHAP